MAKRSQSTQKSSFQRSRIRTLSFRRRRFRKLSPLSWILSAWNVMVGISFQNRSA